MQDILDSKRFMEYDLALSGKVDKSVTVYQDALYSVKDIFDTGFLTFCPESCDENMIERLDRVLLAIMNLVVGNSTPSYECSSKLRVRLANTKLGDKIFQMCEYLLPLPRSQWGDLSTNPDTASGLFDVNYDVQRVANFYGKMKEQNFGLVKDDFNVAPEEEIHILIDYLTDKLASAKEEASTCLKQIQGTELAEDVYDTYVRTGTPLEMVYEDLLGIVKIVAMLAETDAE